MTFALLTARLLRSLCLISGLGCALACRNLDQFDSKPGQAYCGTIGSPAFQSGFEKDGRPPKLKLALTLDTSKLTPDPGFDARDGSFRAFGFLRSQEGDDNTNDGICEDQPLFADAPLRAIPEVERDVISALSFGEGHEQDIFAWVDSSCQGTMLAVVSLMKNNQIELRLFKPAPVPARDADAAHRPGFALFHLAPKPLTAAPEQGCGFVNP